MFSSVRFSKDTFKPMLTIFGCLALFLGACSAPAPAASPAEPVVETAAATPETAEDEEVEGSESADLFPLTIIDAAGQEFTFDEPPTIGCWWRGCDEGLVDLGLAAHASSMSEEQSTSVLYAANGPPTHLIADSQNPELWAAAEVDIVMTRVPVQDSHAASANATQKGLPEAIARYPSPWKSTATD